MEFKVGDTVSVDSIYTLKKVMNKKIEGTIQVHYGLLYKVDGLFYSEHELYKPKYTLSPLWKKLEGINE